MLIDSNIIIYALNNDSPKQQIAQLFIENNLQNLCLAHQNILETLRIITHTKYPHPFSTQKALKAINLITTNMTVLYPAEETELLFYQLVKKYRVTGTQIFDSYLVATALTNGENTIASDNFKHLFKYEEITLVNPFK